jgi:methylated-DNA-protein-cysteine methyltransferase-like protein
MAHCKKNPMKWNPIYALVKKIPRGRVISYGQLAKALRLSGGARTAGRAMAASPAGQGVPWHRVVGAGGRLLIREPYASLQRKLLESEGLTLAEKRILDFKNYEWSPTKVRRRQLAKRRKRL